MSGVIRSTALRAGGACVRCRKGKTKCVYDRGPSNPCKNCAKGMHDCYLPSEAISHHSGQSPARHANQSRPPRDSLPAAGAGVSEGRHSAVGTSGSRHSQANSEKLTPELIAECERIVTKTFPASVAFHKPSFLQQLKSASLESTLVYGLLTFAARSSSSLIRRYGTSTLAAETYAAKTITLINANLDQPNLADIQALCLLIVHEWGSRNAVRAYIYLGQAARMLQMYRILNSFHAADNTDQFVREESFRRTLWLIYILDCLLTSTPGRFPALTQQDTSTVSLPCADINFTFGNAVRVNSLLQHLNRTAVSPHHGPSAEIGEYGFIVIAATLWRDVVGMLTTSTIHSYDERDCCDLIAKIDDLRASLPMQLVDKPGQANLHITMGSGYTFAMLHCLLHCATIFVHRRRLLQDVYAHDFTPEQYQASNRGRDIIDKLFTSCHSILSLLTAVETGAEKDQLPSYPIFMLFSAFTASAIVAYLSLKGLTPSTAVETAANIVTDGVRLMHEGSDNWPLMSSWLRHIAVMQRVLNNDAAASAASAASAAGHQDSSGQGQIVVAKDEVSSNADTNPDAMDHDSVPNNSAPLSAGENSRDGSEPPPTVAIPRRPGVTTINGHSSGVATPNNSTPPPTNAPQPETHDVKPKLQSPESGANGSSTPHAQTAPITSTSQDMTAPELCAAFERQLLDQDDLAAFMGGGV